MARASKAIWWVLVAILGASAANCSGDARNGEPDYGLTQQALEATEAIAVSVSLPVGADPRRIGLGIAGDVYVADRAKLVSANRTWMPVTANVGTTRTEIGADASVGTVIGYDRVFLRSRSIVNGDAFSKKAVERQSGATVAGQILENQQFPPGVVDITKFGWTTTVPRASSTPIMLEPDTTRTLAGGAYGDVSVKSRATLKLSSARLFRFRSLMVEPGGILEVADNLPTELYVDNTVTYRGAIKTPTASTPPPITMAIFGSGQMSFESTIRALMIAPQGKVVLGGISRDFFGSVFGKAVELRPDVILHHIGFDLPLFDPNGAGGSGTDGGVVDLPDVPDPFVSAPAHCGPRDKLAFSAWPMQGFCPAQLALSPFVGTRTNELHWLAALPSAPVVQPVVGNGANVHVVSDNKVLTTLSPQGNVRWTAVLADVAAAAPTILRNGDVVVPLKNGSVQALTRDGQPRWTATATCTGAPTAPNVEQSGNLLVGCANGNVALLTPGGTRTWSVAIGGAVKHPVTVGDPGTVLAVGQSQIVRLARQDGATVWTRALSGAPVGPALLVRDTAYVATANGKLQAFAVDGTAKWQTDLGGVPSGALAVSPWGLLLVPMQSGEIVAVAVDSGAINKRTSLGAQPVTQILVGSDGVAYAQASDNRVTAVVPSTSRVLWTYPLTGAPRGITLTDEGFILAATASNQVIAIGSSPHWTIDNPIAAAGDGGTDGGGVSGDVPHGFTPAACLAQKLATGLSFCDPGGAHWGDRGRIATTHQGGSTIVRIGHSACLPASPPPNLTSQGLGGLGYLATQTNGVDTGQLSFNPPANAPSECTLSFCQRGQDGIEHPISLPFSRIAQDPTGLSTTCPAMAASLECPVDPATNTHRHCQRDSECASGEICAVFCGDGACQSPETACGKRSQCQTGALAAEPTGAFNKNTPSTWPCEEFLECAETGPVYGATGDPDLQKTESLEQRGIPRADFMHSPSMVVPATYANYAQTLAADPCNSTALGGTSNKQTDSRAGSSGNQKWGLFVEPDLSQKFEVELGEILALPKIDIEGSGSFRAGARVWGKEIEIINAKAEAVLSTCGGHLAPSLKILGTELKEWAAFASGDFPPAPSPPTAQESVDCNNAVNSLNDKLANVKKALLDSRAAWDAYRRNGQRSPQALCDRTRAILGNVDPGGCTVESARAWLRRYQNLVTQTESYVDNQYRAALAKIADKTEGAVTFAPATGGPFADIGASASYPIGPIVLTLEISVAGDVDASGRLFYSMGLENLINGDGGPKVGVEAAPGAHVDAFVFVGVGIPGVSAGIEGQLRLIGVTAPLHAAVGLSRTGYIDPRPFDSSGIFAFVSDGPGLLRNGSMQKWNAQWSYGSGVVLDTLSGRISLAVRVRLLFFKKTFRKQIAEWKGLQKTFEFVGKLHQPLAASHETDVVMSNVPYPQGTGNIEAAFNATAVGPNLPVTTLGNVSDPGACGCADLGKPCTASSDCCNAYQCLSGICKTPPPIPPTPPTPPTVPPDPVK